MIFSGILEMGIYKKQFIPSLRSDEIKESFSKFRRGI